MLLLADGCGAALEKRPDDEENDQDKKTEDEKD
jgi:hypothetical protein